MNTRISTPFSENNHPLPNQNKGFSVTMLNIINYLTCILKLSPPPSLPPLVISVDGVPFLMHDHTLQRTTDIAKVFPDRRTDDASHFNWTDLQQLNAGQWFLKVLPGC